MKKVILTCLIITVVIAFMSCARGITPFEAANGKARCGRFLR